MRVSTFLALIEETPNLLDIIVKGFFDVLKQTKSNGREPNSLFRMKKKLLQDVGLSRKGRITILTTPNITIGKELGL